MLHTRILFSCDKGERTKIGKKCVNKEHGRWSSDVYEMAVLMNLLCQKQLSLSLPSSSAPFLKKKKINGEKLKLFISMYGIYLRIWKGPLGLVCQSRLSHTFFSSSSVNFHLFEFIYNDLPLIKSTFSSPYQTSFIQKQQ